MGGGGGGVAPLQVLWYQRWCYQQLLLLPGPHSPASQRVSTTTVSHTAARGAEQHRYCTRPATTTSCPCWTGEVIYRCRLPKVPYWSRSAPCDVTQGVDIPPRLAATPTFRCVAPPHLTAPCGRSNNSLTLKPTSAL